MRCRWAERALIAAPLLLGLVEPGLSHITPPVVLISDRDAVVGMLAGAVRFFVREVRLTPEERDRLHREWRWRAEDEVYRFYLGRDDRGRLVGAVIFITEYTIHGPVRVAVGLGPDGKVKDSRVIELTEETYPWLKPLLDQNFTQDYVGRESRASFAVSERFRRGTGENMSLFYAQIVTNLIQRAAALYEVAVLKRLGNPS